MIVAVDVGASKIRVAAMDEYRVVRKKVVEFPRTQPLGVAKLIANLAREVAGERIEAVGVGCIGPLDIKRGWVINTPNAPVKCFPVKKPLEEELGCRVILANDCIAAVWGEYVYGGGRGLNSIAYVTISSGIGGGFIVDGRLVVGWRGNAHEIGHLVLNYKSRIKCGCGGIGHWEALASGSGIPKFTRELAGIVGEEEFRSCVGYERALEKGLSPEELYSLARAGDSFAKLVVEELNKVHAAGIASIASAYDPQIVFIGGGLFLANKDLILPGVEKYLRIYCLSKPPVIKEASFGEDEVLVGASALVYKTPPELEV